MRFLKWISVLIILAVLFAMLPATVAEDEIVIGPVEVDGQAPEIEMDDAAVIEAIDDPALAPEDAGIELDGLENDLLISESEESVEASVASNASGDFEIDEEGALTRYRGVDKNVVIPDGVKAIGDEAFENDTLMESVSIPNSVTYIGYEAFSGCTALKSIMIPDSVTETATHVFSGCTSLVSVQLSNRLTALSSNIFSYCDSLERITLPNSLKSIGAGALSSCIKLKDISIPASCTEIDRDAFRNCNSLESITLPNGAISIGESAFGNCDKLQSITIPASVTSIDRAAFDGSSNVIIRGTAGTYAERFANGVGIPFNAPVVTFDEKIYYDWEDEYTEYTILYANQSYTLNAIQKPDDLARTLAWSSSDTNVVTVDQSGRIAGVSQGTATITANTADGKGKAAKIKVVVPEPTRLSFTYYTLGDEIKDLEIKLRDTEEVYVKSEIPYEDETKVDMPLTLTSSDDSIVTAQLTEDNKVTLKAINLGKAIVTATTPDGGKSSIEVEVIRPDAESVKIDQSGPIKLYPGQKCALSTTIAPADAMPKLTWSSWDTEIATVDQEGMVTAVEPGETEIYVETYNDSYGDIDDSIDIHVLIPPKKIALSKSEAIIAVGDTLTLKKTLTPEDAETGFTWSSSRSSVATVTQKGKVTALKTGKAKITVKTDNGKSASATITVKPAPTKIVLNKTRATLGVREKLTLKAAVSPSKAYTTLTWKSSAKAVATVSKQGVVIPKKPGTAVITVRTKNGKTAKCTVTVKSAPKKVTLNKTGTVTLKKGKKLKLKATLPKDTASALTWKSSKPKVASVDQKGNVRALKKGTAVITVKTFNGRTAKVTIKVK